MGRADQDPVVVVRHDPAWASQFVAERRLLEPVVAPWITGGIHHVGSTAVPGLDAKPIIDILVGIDDLGTARGAIEPLARLAYHFFPYRPEDMLWFCKPGEVNRTHHLHLVPTDSERYRHELAFRDALRRDVELVHRYAALKHDLARRFRDDRERYTEEKTGFIREVLEAVTGDGSRGPLSR